MNVISPAKICIYLESIKNNPPPAKISLELIKNTKKYFLPYLKRRPMCGFCRIIDKVF